MPRSYKVGRGSRKRSNSHRRSQDDAKSLKSCQIGAKSRFFVFFASFGVVPPPWRLPERRSISAGRGAPVPLPAANDCCGFGEGTFASPNGDGQDAPVADPGGPNVAGSSRPTSDIHGSCHSITTSAIERTTGE